VEYIVNPVSSMFEKDPVMSLLSKSFLEIKQMNNLYYMDYLVGEIIIWTILRFREAHRAQVEQEQEESPSFS